MNDTTGAAVRCMQNLSLRSQLRHILGEPFLVRACYLLAGLRKKYFKNNKMLVVQRIST